MRLLARGVSSLAVDQANDAPRNVDLAAPTLRRHSLVVSRRRSRHLIALLRPHRCRRARPRPTSDAAEHVNLLRTLARTGGTAQSSRSSFGKLSFGLRPRFAAVSICPCCIRWTRRRVETPGRAILAPDAESLFAGERVANDRQERDVVEPHQSAATGASARRVCSRIRTVRSRRARRRFGSIVGPTARLRCEGRCAVGYS